MLTQVLLQTVWPPEQVTGIVQLPATQTLALAPQTLSHEPQCLLSVCRLTQVLLQRTFEQLKHCPAEQYWPVAQTLPHVPQLVTSVCRS
jgi:hypothetical protein